MDAFVVKSDLLLKEIRLAKGFINTRSRKPILQCVRVAVDNQQAHVTATDLEVSLTRTFPVQQQGEPFVGVINYDLLANIAKELPGAITLESGHIGEEPAVVIRQSAGALDSEFKLYTQGDEFPRADRLGGEPLIRVNVADLMEAMKWVLPALSDESHYGLIFRQDDGGYLTLGATNGHVLAGQRGRPEDTGLPGGPEYAQELS